MRIKLLMGVAVGVFAVVNSKPASAGDKESLTNRSIVRMVKAKLGEDVIISKIGSSKTDFDLSTDGLIGLKEEGVSDAVINAMQNPQGKPPAAREKAEADSSSGDVSIAADGKKTEMEYVAGFSKVMGHGLFNYSLKTTTLIMASGERASFRIKDGNPSFYTKLHPSEIGLVKFDTDTYNDKVVRYVKRVGSLYQAAGGNEAGGPGQDNIDFDFKKEDGGVYKISLRQPLDKGEYGIIVTKAGALGMFGAPSSTYKIYDFGVDK